MSSVSLRTERGSVLVGGLVLVFVITLVGVAIFDLSLSEPRLIADRQNKVQAAYVADAGMSIAWEEMSRGATKTFDIVWGGGQGVNKGTNIVPTAGGTATVTPASDDGRYQRTYQVQKCISRYPKACTDVDTPPLPADQFVARSTGTVVRLVDGATVGQALVELTFSRAKVSGIVALNPDPSGTAASLSGGGGILDSWNSCPLPMVGGKCADGTTPICGTPPCAYDATKAGAVGNIFSNGAIAFSFPDTIRGNITAVGHISLDGSHVFGDVQSGGNISTDKVTSGATSPRIEGNATATGSIVGASAIDTIAGNATAGGAIVNQTVLGLSRPNQDPAPPAPTPLPYPSQQVPKVQRCNTTGTAFGQYVSGDPTRAASGYSAADYVKGKIQSATSAPGSGVVKLGTTTVYTESTGIFNTTMLVSAVTITAGTLPAVATFCFNSLSTSSGTTLRISGVTNDRPVTIYLTGDNDVSNINGPISNPTFDASRLQIYSSYTDSGTSHGITLNGSPSAYLTIYAPGTDIRLNGGSAIYGRFVANTFEGTNGADVHYDQALAIQTNCPLCAAVWKRVPNTWKLTVLQ